MADIAQRGNRLTKKHISKDLVRNVYEHVAPKHSPGQKGKPHSSKEGRTASIGRTVRDTMKILTGAERVKKFGGGRTNLLEELGRVEGERSNPNRRAEISRVHGELNRGYAKGGRAGHAKGGRAGHFAGSLVKNIPKLLKKLGKEIKAQPLPPQLQKTLDEVKKLQKLQKPIVKKAAGGRIGKKHGFQVLGGGVEGKPHSTYEGRNEAGRRKFKRLIGEDPGKRNRDFGKTAGRMARAARKKDFKTHGKDVPTMAAEGGRAGHAIGGIALSAKRALGKLKKPSGVFKKGKKTHGKDVPTMAATGGRIGSKGLKK